MRALETLFVILLVCGSCGDSGDDPAPGYTVEVQAQDGGPSALLTVEVARTAQERTKGLMDRQSLGADAGMLFVFGHMTASSFWMKDTHVPLDIAYLGEDGVIQEIHQGVPLSEELIEPEQPYWYALEVNRDWFASHGFAPGDRVIIPEDITGTDGAARAPAAAAAAWLSRLTNRPAAIASSLAFS